MYKNLQQKDNKLDYLREKLGCLDINNSTIELNEQQDEFILHCQNGLRKTIKFSDGFQQITITAKIPQPDLTQNTYVREDLMSFIANIINNTELNITMSLIQNSLQYQIQYAIIIEHDQQLSKNIDQILLEMSEQIEKLSNKAYYFGDENLEEWINDLIKDYEMKL